MSEFCRCFFCGKEYVAMSVKYVLSYPLYSVLCYECNARGPTEETAEKATQKWNEIASLVFEAQLAGVSRPTVRKRLVMLEAAGKLQSKGDVK